MKSPAFLRIAGWALLLLVVACAKPVPADYQAYVGHWKGGDVRLGIDAAGNAVYERKSTGNSLSISGPIHDFSRDGFKIGLGRLSASFDVDQPPTRTETGWKMTVDGVELTRIGAEKPAQKAGTVSL